jgi:hypothetical protein
MRTFFALAALTVSMSGLACRNVSSTAEAQAGESASLTAADTAVDLRAAIAAHEQAGRPINGALTRCSVVGATPATDITVFGDGAVSIVYIGGPWGHQAQGGVFPPGKFTYIVSSAGDEFYLDFDINGAPAHLEAMQSSTSSLRVGSSSVVLDCELL